MVTNKPIKDEEQQHNAMVQFTGSFNVNAIQLIEGVGTIDNIFESVASKLYRSEHNANKFDNQEL